MGRTISYSVRMQVAGSTFAVQVGDWSPSLGVGAFETRSAPVPDSVTDDTPLSGMILMPAMSQGFASVSGTWGAPQVDDTAISEGAYDEPMWAGVDKAEDGSLHFWWTNTEPT